MSDVNVLYDEQGHPRQFNFQSASTSLTGSTPQEAAKTFLRENAAALDLPQQSSDLLDTRASIAPLPENEALRFESEKNLMDSTVVSYTQTMFGLPVYQAGVAVTMQSGDNKVRSASSTLHYDIQAEPPGASLMSRAPAAGPTGGYDQMVRDAIPAAADMRINRTRLMVYRYEADKRVQGHAHEAGESGFHREAPTLPLPPLPPSIQDGTHYISVEAMFSYALPDWGMLNWRAFVEVETGAVLMLRALVDGVTGLVFDRDPITKTGNLANLPNASSAVLDVLRDAVGLTNLGPASGGTQSLAGSFVRLGNYSAPNAPAPTTTTPFNFAYVSRTDDFAAVNAYYHCDRFFRMVRDTGFSIPTYFGGTGFPVLVDHRGLGNAINAQCPGNTMGNGIGAVQFALADGNTASPLGIAADWRVVLHELGGHGILWNHVDSPNFGFAHSAGDSIAVIANDPASAAQDRFVSFPWVNIGRRHDRPVNGWGWGGANDLNGYFSEQILATCHFRLYRSIGGDSTYLARREFAARSAVYLILRGVGQLTPVTNPPTPTAWEQQLETADAGVWTSTAPAETHAGGAYHKVIRWAFEKQGLFRAPGDPATVEGKPPPVDVYIDDGRGGQYPFQPNHWSCTDIWNRRMIGDGGGVHEEPVVGQANYAYVRIKNRGTQAATNVVVRGFHCLPGVGLEYPTDWIAMATPQLPAPNVAASDAVGAIVGPFQWTPSQVGHECMFFSVSADGDASNIDGAITGSIPEWRLVPHDNNIGQRNVHPVTGKLADVRWDKLPFWIRNRSTKPIQPGVDIRVPTWLSRLGWQFDVPEITTNRTGVEPGDLLKVALKVQAGKPASAKAIEKESDRDIVVTVLQDDMPVGGMTFRITPGLRSQPADGVAAGARAPRRTAARRSARSKPS